MMINSPTTLCIVLFTPLVCVEADRQLVCVLVLGILQRLFLQGYIVLPIGGDKSFIQQFH